MSFMTDRLFQILEGHRLYDCIGDRTSLRLFLERHIICVWSYQALLKSLHRDLVLLSQPVQSEPFKEAMYLISEIVLDELVEAQADGSFHSHLELYLDAMADLGCDTQRVSQFFEQLERKMPVKRALQMAGFSGEAQVYGLATIKHLHAATHMKAAALFYEGEPFIPDSFLQRLDELASKYPVERLIDYFERHIEGLKKPGFSAAGRLVEILCQDNQILHEDAESVAQAVMKQRVDLWDAMANQLEARHPSAAFRGAHPPLKLLVNQP